MSEASPALTRRHDFVLFFDVTNGNPNGDPDAGNLPRLDPETNCGLVTDVCLKRKVRNFVELFPPKPNGKGYRIYVTEGAILNNKHREAFFAVRGDSEDVRTAKKLSPKGDEEATKIRRWMCDNFFDIRAFGAVLSTGINAGQVRGPVQFTFGRSVEPVLPLEIAITRMAATNEAEKAQREAAASEDERRENRTMGRKHIIPYGLYRAHGFVSASLASHDSKGTGFTDADLELLWTALRDMFEHDRSATRGEMATRKLIIFEHQSALGNAHADKLFERVKVWRKHPDANAADPQALHAIGSVDIDSWPPSRRFADYAVTIDETDMPSGVHIRQL